MLQATSIRYIRTDRCMRPDASQRRKGEYAFYYLYPAIGKRIRSDTLLKNYINPWGIKAAGTRKSKKHKNIPASTEGQAKTVVKSISLWSIRIPIYLYVYLYIYCSSLQLFVPQVLPKTEMISKHWVTLKGFFVYNPVWNRFKLHEIFQHW